MKDILSEILIATYGLWGVCAALLGRHFIKSGKDVEALLCAILVAILIILIKLS